jgi:hypothetical protein
MNSHTSTITPLMARALRNGSGDCTCLECGATGLASFMMAEHPALKGPTCQSCLNRILSGYVRCDECRGTGGNTRMYHPVRGEPYNDWCERCNGDQRVFVGVPERFKVEVVA